MTKEEKIDHVANIIELEFGDFIYTDDDEMNDELSEQIVSCAETIVEEISN